MDINNKETLFSKNQMKDFFPLEELKENKNLSLLKWLWDFLIDKWYIKDIDQFDNSRAYMYNSEEKKIYIWEQQIPNEEYEKFIFRLWKNSDGKYIFPNNLESNIYRLLHEIGHAYQDFLIDKESKNEAKNRHNWHNKIINGEWEDSYFGMLMKFCYKLRKETWNRNWLSIFGNISAYDYLDTYTQNFTRALEDSNELVNMYLWNPEYLKIFLSYITWNIEWFDKDFIVKDWFVVLDIEKATDLYIVIEEYVNEMKNTINKKQLYEEQNWFFEKIFWKILKK